MITSLIITAGYYTYLELLAMQFSFPHRRYDFHTMKSLGFELVAIRLDVVISVFLTILEIRFNVIRPEKRAKIRTRSINFFDFNISILK